MATGRLPDPNTAPVTAKGDLYTYSTVPAKLAVGSNGETLVADSSATTGLRWQGNFAAGKNAIINGDFRIWQRGTSFSVSNGASPIFTADRFAVAANFSAGTTTASQQTFTPGTAPVAGYEGAFFHRLALGSTATYYEIFQKIEDVRTFAGQTITVSFWAKASSSTTTKTLVRQNFGSGGSANVDYLSTASLTTSWQRFTWTFTLGSLSGKTIGTNSFLQFYLYQDTGALGGLSIDLWGVQVEIGNTATAFQTATGTLAGELAACQRYYYKHPASGTVNTSVAAGGYYAASTYIVPIPFPVTMRVAPTFAVTTVTNGYQVLTNGGLDTLNSLTQETANTQFAQCYNNTEAGSVTGYYGQLTSQSASTSLAWSAEL